MSLLHRVFLPALAVAGLGFLIACGGSSNNSTPPPSGGFSNTNFNGTYTFSIAGNDGTAAQTLGASTIAGTITACGCSSGQITAGTIDLADTSGPSGPLAISSNGSGYKVNVDGTGTITLDIPQSGTNPIQIQFVFVLTDAAHGFISEYDQLAAGSGTIDLQSSAVALSNASYAFSLSGGVNSQTLGPVPLAAVGSFTLNSSGAITSGSVDFNDNGTPSGGLALTGSVSAGTGTTPGTASLSSTAGSLTFDVYAIDSTHLKVIENDGTAILVGDVFSQPTATMPSGTLAFTMAGLNIPALTNPNLVTPPSVLAVGGTVTSDGNSRLSSGAEDFNANGTIDNGGTNSASFTGSFGLSPTANTNGRFQIALSGFAGGTNFVAYPFSGGVLMLENDQAGTLTEGGITAGAALLQNSPAGVVASQGYAINLTGADIANGTELDQIAQFNTTSSSLAGTIYYNDFGVLTNNYGLGSSSQLTPGATGEVVLNFNSGNEGALYYGVDGATSLALGVDSSDVSLGVIQQQGSPTSTADVAARHLAVIKAVARAAKKKKQQ